MADHVEKIEATASAQFDQIGGVRASREGT
jgi:hypothetical protein